MRDIDPDTKREHKIPVGFEDHGSRKNGRYLVTINVPHYIVEEHQNLFPELKEKMKVSANPSREYGAFLSMLPIELHKKLDETKKLMILKSFKVIKNEKK